MPKKLGWAKILSLSISFPSALLGLAYLLNFAKEEKYISGEFFILLIVGFTFYTFYMLYHYASSNRKN